MRFRLLPLVVLALLGARSAAAVAEADYTLDDSFWNEESPVGEVERLLREYRQNQELVRNIGAHYYQIIYPVQLRHHEKMGISTREVGGKFPGGRGGYGQGADGSSYQGQQRGRTRTGKHFHRTSLLIKAFNHKFRLDLELNTQLLAPNLRQVHYLSNGAEQQVRQEIEHCYYHGTVKDYPGATAAFHTCNGVSGVIHIGNETFVIHPFYGGDLSKHPHVIFEARTKANKGCANSGAQLEWRRHNTRRSKHISFLHAPVSEVRLAEGGRERQQWAEAVAGAARRRRDVGQTTKYIETALVLDRAMFDKRNGSTRAEIVHDAIQVVNIADLYFRTLNTRVSLVYLESWQGANQALIDKSQDITRALLNFNDYTSRKLFKYDKDTTQLLTGVTFLGGEAGMAVPETVCTPKSVGISVDSNTYEPHLLAGTMAHMIGHNIGMGHDDGREQCYCRDWHGCIMAQTIVGLDNVQPYKFSECSKSDYIDALRQGHGICLLNKPNEVSETLVTMRTCGNGKLEEGEECDCGTIDECHKSNPCCDPITCRLTAESQCASGDCCENCKLKQRGVTCREAANECDLEESCTGASGACPADAHRKNGAPCAQSTGYCFSGRCPTVSLQCETVWGYGTTNAERACYDHFNTKGTDTGHCGKDPAGNFLKCQSENIRCGSLQCQHGNRHPSVPGMEAYTRTIITVKGVDYECKVVAPDKETPPLPLLGLVQDGTPCGDNLVCVNQTCTSIFPFIDQSECPTDHNNNECSGKGICSNANKCHCSVGFTGPDCSLIDHEPPPPMLPPPKEPTKASYNMTKKETPYENYHGSNTVFLVAVLMSVVGGVFIVFALSALCYRKKSPQPKYDPPYHKKPVQKTFPGSSGGSNHSQEEIALDTKMSFNNVASSFRGLLSRGDSQRVLFRHGNHMGGSGNSSRFQDHKMKRLHSNSEDEPNHSGEEDTVAFIDVAPNSMSKLPEKGILKKHGYGVDPKDKWNNDDSASDHLDVASQSDSQEPAGTVADMEYKFKDLNGYHEGIIVALKTAAAQRAGAGAAVAADDLRAVQEYEYKHQRAASAEKLHEADLRRARDDDDDDQPQCGPIRIRNLEDLIRQLEHHSSRHMSPSGSEDIRMSETEADRHYRLDTGEPVPSRCRGRMSGEEETRFGYSRYRAGSGTSAAGSRTHLAPHLAPHLLYPHPHAPHRAPPDDDALYETADHADRLRDAPDSESSTTVSPVGE